MSVALPILTLLLIGVGALCLFVAMDNASRTRRASVTKELASERASLGGEARPAPIGVRK